MANRSSVILALVAGPIVIGAAYSISSLLTAGDAAGGTASTEMSLAYGLLLLGWCADSSCGPVAIIRRHLKGL